MWLSGLSQAFRELKHRALHMAWVGALAQRERSRARTVFCKDPDRSVHRPSQARMRAAEVMSHFTKTLGTAGNDSGHNSNCATPLVGWGAALSGRTLHLALVIALSCACYLPESVCVHGASNILCNLTCVVELR